MDEERELFSLDFMLIEGQNVLWKQVRKGAVTPECGAELFSYLMGLHTNGYIVLDQAIRYLHPAAELAYQYDHPVYDTLYVAAAAEKNAQLLTADQKQAFIAQNQSVQCIQV